MGFWLVSIASQDSHRIYLLFHTGTYQYIRMSFGLTKALATFQRTVEMVLRKFKWKTCLIYMEDAIIYWNSVEEHITHIDKVFNTFAKVKARLKMKKFILFSDKEEYLGPVICPRKLEVDNEQTVSSKKRNVIRVKVNSVPFRGCVTSIDKLCRNLQVFIIH